MCGICGVVYKDGSAVDRGMLKASADLIKHRGPDDEGFYVEGPVGLANRRLSIIDIKTGQQPISLDDGNLTIVFNGEIYNYQILQEELEAKGVKLKTRSDTEVILALYREMGTDCVLKLRGMFAFAIWDKKKERLFISRDRIGKKPLLYANEKGFLAFGSEMRCLFIWPISKEIDKEAIDQYLTLQYIPAPLTIYKNVRKLPPGHSMILQKGKLSIERYWKLPLGEKPITDDPVEAQELIRDKLLEATKMRMISEVPLGAFLSGGVDSSTIVALMAQSSERPVKTFSIGFEEDEFSELPYARQIAKLYGCEHTEFIVKPEMTEVLPKLAWHYGEPYADSSALPTYYVSKETRKHVTVALNGDGGDENFAGYTRHWAMKVAQGFDMIPSPIRKMMEVGSRVLPEKNAPFGLAWRAKRFLRSAVFSDIGRRYVTMVGYFNEFDKNTLYSEGFKRDLVGGATAETYLGNAFKAGKSEDFINQILHVDFNTYLPECLMVKVDIASMANSLEGRSPLLDHEFVEMVYRMPGHWKLKGIKTSKWILKEAFKDKLPANIIKRPKMGFGIPVHAWFRGPLKEFWESHVLSEKALARGFFDEKGLRKFWDDHQSRKRENGYRLWALLMLELWFQVCHE